MRDPGIDLEEYRRSPRPARQRPRRERRSRLVAVIVLVVAAVVLLVAGLSGRSSESGGSQAGQTVPFSILPLAPQDLSGTTQTSATTTTEAGSDESDTRTTIAMLTPDDSVSTVAFVDPQSGDENTPTDEVAILASTLTSTAATASASASVALDAASTDLAPEADAAVTAPAATAEPDVPVLMYHYVADVPPSTGPYASGMTVRIGAFEEQMRYLADNGYHTVGLGDVLLARRGLKALPSKPVVLTFDDGGLDNYQVAFPILNKYGFTATFFVVTGKVGATGHMDWDDLLAMAAEGMSIESHTVSHPADLRALDQVRLETELDDSRTAIAQRLGLIPECLAYPSGRYDERVIAAAKAAGYLVAVSTNSGTDTEPEADFQISRVRVVAFESLGDFASSLQ